jgi:hypothetical protein
MVTLGRSIAREYLLMNKGYFVQPEA